MLNMSMVLTMKNMKAIRKKLYLNVTALVLSLILITLLCWSDLDVFAFAYAMLLGLSLFCVGVAVGRVEKTLEELFEKEDYNG